MNKTLKNLAYAVAMIVAVSLLSACNGKTQKTEETNEQQATNKAVASTVASFKEDIIEYMGYNLKYPEEAVKAAVNIRVLYSFVIDVDGSVKDIKWVTTHVEKDSKNPDVVLAQKACEKAALAAIESTSGQWIPATNDNQPVASEMTLPIWFKFH